MIKGMILFYIQILNVEFFFGYKYCEIQVLKEVGKNYKLIFIWFFCNVYVD